MVEILPDDILILVFEQIYLDLTLPVSHASQIGNLHSFLEIYWERSKGRRIAIRLRLVSRQWARMGSLVFMPSITAKMDTWERFPDVAADQRLEELTIVVGCSTFKVDKTRQQAISDWLRHSRLSTLSINCTECQSQSIGHFSSTQQWLHSDLLQTAPSLTRLCLQICWYIGSYHLAFFTKTFSKLSFLEIDASTCQVPDANLCFPNLEILLLKTMITDKPPNAFSLWVLPSLRVFSLRNTVLPSADQRIVERLKFPFTSCPATLTNIHLCLAHAEDRQIRQHAKETSARFFISPEQCRNLQQVVFHNLIPIFMIGRATSSSDKPIQFVFTGTKFRLWKEIFSIWRESLKSLRNLHHRGMALTYRLDSCSWNVKLTTAAVNPTLMGALWNNLLPDVDAVDKNNISLREWMAQRL